MHALDDLQLWQLNLGTLAMVILFTLLTRRDQWLARAVFGIMTGLLLINYLVWRVRETLPDIHAGFATLWSYAFLFFESLAITYTLVSIVVMLIRSDHRKSADAGEYRLRAAGRHVPAVDVFICTYNEGLDVLEKTIIAAKAMDYPHFNVWVLDDTRRDWLRDYCLEMGVHYARRPDNSHAKAGNLNNGLRTSQASTNAPYILVLDADFAPQQPILMRTLGLFEDPKVALVQTPQFYYNPDPIQHNLGSSTCWVDEQRVFFDVFQPAKDGWDAAFCVGTSFVVRRDRINEIGGFPTGSVCEDIYTTYRLLQHGYVTRWLNERLSIGLSAEGLTEYINQRGRWCLGTIQVALLADGPLRGRGYTLNDRLHYIHGMLHWFSKPFILMMLISPLLYWYFGIAGFYAKPMDFLAFGMPALIAFWGYGTWVTDRRTLPIFTEVTQIVASLAVTATIVSALIRPFGRPFKVTAKGLDRTQAVVHWKLFGFFFFLTLFAQVGAFTAIATADTFDGNVQFNLCWTVVALVYNVATLVACVDRPRLHGEERFPFVKPAGLHLAGRMFAGQLTDISISGASFACAHAAQIKPGLRGTVWVNKVGRVPVEVKRQTGDGRLGLQFVDLDEPLRQRLIGRLFSDANTNVAGKAKPAVAFSSLLRRSLIGEKQPRKQVRPRRARRPGRFVQRHGSMIVGVLALLLLAGCSLEPTYERPDAPIDQQWPSNAQGGAGEAKLAFEEDWHRFITDPRLRQVIDLALENNRGLRQFAASVEESRAESDGAHASLFPSIGINTYAGRSKIPPLVRTQGGGVSSGSTDNTFQATAGFTSYELDLFGRLRSQRNAADARFEASEADYQTARLALIGEVVSTWLSLKANQTLLDLAQSTFKSQEHYGQLLRSSYNLGSTARIDVHQGDAMTNTAAVQVNTYRMKVAQNLNALRVLAGQPVPESLLPQGDLAKTVAIADVPAGLPSSLIQRRPDIMSAEALLRASNADIGAARSAYFPTLSLTGALGSLSGDFSKLLTGPAEFWQLAAAGSMTLIDGGQRRAVVDASHARYDANLAAYEGTVQNAFREAADALNARQEMLAQVAAQKRLVEDYQEAWRQSRLRFEAGMDSYFSTMDAQRSLFAAQQEWLTLELARQVNQVNLYKALGGGWSPPKIKVAQAN